MVYCIAHPLVIHLDSAYCFTDAEVLKKCIQNCLYLEQLNPEENPFIEEVDNR